MNHANGGVPGRTWPLKRSSAVLDDEDEPLIAKMRRRKYVRKRGSSDMEPHIWRNLPDDLIEHVLTRLPIARLVQFRLVCKRWNLLLTKKSPTFSIPPSSQPWFYILYSYLRDRGGYELSVSMYDPCSNKWYHPDFPSLPANNECFRVVGSAGGLICFVNDDLAGLFYVWNPITQSIKELPRIEGLSPIGFGRMMLDTSSTNATTGRNDYYIVIWIDWTLGLFAFYHSRDNSWTIPAVRIPLQDMEDWSFYDSCSKLVHVDGTLYVYKMGSSPGLVSCDLATLTWKTLNAPEPRNVVKHWIKDYQGKIVLAGFVDDKTTTVCSQQICIWELNKTAELFTWEVIDKMVLVETIEFWWAISCCGSEGDLIMWIAGEEKERRHVIYNFKTREWLSTVVFVQHHRKTTVLQGTPFHPCPFVLP